MLKALSAAQKNMRTAIIIANMGGPESLDSVEPYLKNIFNDPAIISIPLPASWRNKLATFIARKRQEESKQIYRKIGGKTPLTDITKLQAKSLETALNTNSEVNFNVFPAMRYWHPFIEDVWNKIGQQSFDHIIFISLYPFYSLATSGSLFELLKRIKKESQSNTTASLSCIDRFGNHPLFVKAIASQIQKALEQHPDYKDVLLSAHSIPMRSINKGDPYFREIEETVSSIHKHIGGDTRFHLAFQSKVGPVKWLGPSTPDKIVELANSGVKNLLAYPLGFVADNSETVYEIGMLYKDLAYKNGIKGFIRIESLNSHPLFIEMLKRLVLDNLKTKKKN